MTYSHTADQLCDAFEEFEDASHALSRYYRDLERQVEKLAGQLQSSRAEAEQAAEENALLAARLSSLLEALPGGVVVLDQFGRVQEFNPAANALLGDLTVGRPWSEVVEKSFAPRWDDGHDISLADGRLVNIATQALGDEPGQILLVTEVTDTRRLQEQLAHHKRLSAKTEMAAAMAHQIRTPLSAAVLHTGNIERATKESDRTRAASRAMQALRRLESLIKEMLLFARGGSLEVEWLSAAELTRLLNAQLGEIESSDGFAVDVTVSEAVKDTHGIHANRDALTSVALNLIENARLAISGVGQCHVGIERVGDQIQLIFTDTGPGVPEHQQDQLFEPFYTTRASGTGLGLAVARAVARAHGGELDLDRNYGPGARFVMSLPLAADKSGPADNSQEVA